MEIQTATLEELKQICSLPDTVSYCVLMQRPGVAAWAVELEYTKFKPDTDANLRFHLSITEWPHDSDMMYWIVTFHKSAQAFADAILWKNGLKKVREGHIPAVISGGWIQRFPIKGPNIFHLQNFGNNVLYLNDPVKRQKAWEHEKNQCQKFYDEHKRWLLTPEGRATQEEFWRKHPSGKVR
jgi:hypothetical protein